MLYAILTTIKIYLDNKKPYIVSILPLHNTVIKYLADPNTNHIADLVVQESEFGKCKFYGNLATSALQMPNQSNQNDLRNFYDNNMIYLSENYGTFFTYNLDSVLKQYGPSGYNNAPWTFYVACEDYLGNLVSKFNTTNFTVNIEGLVISDYGPSGTVGGSNTVQLYDDTDKTAICTSYDYGSFDTTNNYHHTKTITNLVNGESKNIQVVCTKLIPPVSISSETITFNVDLDVSPIEITNITDSLGNLISNNSITGTVGPTTISINGKVESNSNLIIYLDGSPRNWGVHTENGNFSINYPLAGLPQGLHSFAVNAIDNFSNSKLSNSLSVNLVTDVPSRPYLIPLPTILNTHILNVYGTIGILGITVNAYNDETWIASTTSQSDSTCTYLTSFASAPIGSLIVNVTNILEFQVNNNIIFENHNKSNLLTYQVTAIKDNLFSADYINLSTPLENELISTRIKVCTGDKPSGYFNLSLNLSEGYKQLGFIGNTSVGLVGPANGPYNLLVDTTPPSIELVSPYYNETLSEDRTDLLFTVSDDGSGLNLSKTQIEINGRIFTYLLYPSNFVYNSANKQLKFILPSSSSSSFMPKRRPFRKETSEMLPSPPN